MPVALMYAAHAPSRTTNANVVPQNPILLFLSLSLLWDPQIFRAKKHSALSLCVVVVVVVVVFVVVVFVVIIVIVIVGFLLLPGKEIEIHHFSYVKMMTVCK